MAWGYRNRRRYYRRRFYRRRGYGSGASRRAYGNMRAARQQADNATFTINVPSKFSSFMKKGVQLPGLATGDLRTTGVYPISIYEILRQSEFFNNYANMYDEFKIDKIKVKLLPTSFTINTNGNYRNLTIYTAWDRTGLNTTQLHAFIDQAHPQNNQLYCTIGEDITTYSSAESRTVNPNTNTSITRWLNPKTINEKAQWLSTSLLKQWYTNYDPTSGCFTGLDFNGEDGQLAQIQTATNDWNSLIKYSNMAKDNPCFLLEDPAIKFKPTLLVGVFPAVEAASFDTNTNLIHFNVETEIVCTYRGLRKGKVLGNSAQGQVQPSRIGPKPTPIEADGTYTAASDGLDGYSSVVVRVPGSGGGGSEPTENALNVQIDNEVIRVAKSRNDPVDPNDPSKGTFNGLIDWPKMGDVVWNNYINVRPDNNAKWVDKALINVSQLVLPDEWTQTTQLTPDFTLTRYNQGFDEYNSVYPESFEFTPRFDIPYNNNPPNTNPNTIVRLENTLVNCINQRLNVGDITGTQYAGSQPTPEEITDELNANPLLNPGTHGYWVTVENGENYFNFEFQLPDGQHSKTLDPASGMQGDPIELPRLYANWITGKFKMPQGAQNQRITQPGRYAWGNTVAEPAGEPQVWEVAPISVNGSGEVNNNLRLIKLDDNNQDSLFTIGTFDVDIPSTSIPELSTFNIYVDNLEGMEISRTMEYDDLNLWNKIVAGGTATESFNSNNQNDEGYWVCVYYNPTKHYYGGFQFNVGQSEFTISSFDVVLSNTEMDSTPVYYAMFKYANPELTSERAITAGFGTEEETYLPLSIPITYTDNFFTLNPNNRNITVNISYTWPKTTINYYNSNIYTIIIPTTPTPNLSKKKNNKKVKFTRR